MNGSRNDGTAKRYLAGGILALLFIVVLFNAFYSYSYSFHANYSNVSVDVRVNITDSKPEILLVTVTDPVYLSAGSTVVVQCNATVRDWNGGATISNVSAVFYDGNEATFDSLDDHNDHYTNASCTQNVTYGDLAELANFTCNFVVYYHANNGSNWICNVTVTDSYTFNESVNSTDDSYNTTTINPLFALNISTNNATYTIDYGNLAVGDTSAQVPANITNIGNMDINISLKGYGRTEGDGLAVNCTIGNITIENERYSFVEGEGWTTSTPLSSTFEMIADFNMSQQIVDGTPVVNTTYWRLYVPPNPFGACTGTIVFQAEESGSLT